MLHQRNILTVYFIAAVVAVFVLSGFVGTLISLVAIGVVSLPITGLIIKMFPAPDWYANEDETSKITRLNLPTEEKTKNKIRQQNSDTQNLPEQKSPQEYVKPIETFALMTAEDIAKINSERISRGCLWIIAVPLALVFLFVLINVNAPLLLAAVGGVSLALVFAVHRFIKGKDTKINKDIADGQKKVIVAPITKKKIKSSEIRSGRNKGGVSMEYFMTVAGRDYPMTEHKYTKIPVGEMMEIHLAPASKVVLQEKWLKKDGNVEEEKEEI